MTSGPPAAGASRAARHRRVRERAATSGRAALEATVLRLRSLEGLDVALSLATSGREDDYQEWAARLDAAARDGSVLGDDPDPAWAATLAQILARSARDGSAEAAALLIYRQLASRWGPQTLEARDAQVYGQLLLQAGEQETLRAVLPHLELRPVIRRMLLTDLAQLDVAMGRQSLAAWSAALQELMQVSSLGFDLSDDGDPFRFDGLRSRRTSRTVDGPLITVVVPAYAPDAGLETAVRSILAQTWQHLEVLIVDDASPAATRHHFTEVAALDERVRIVERPRNGGTYAARNTALSAARGEFVTGQDADDWSHPERLERQVRPLLDERSLVATLSRCLRVTDDLRTSSLRASGSTPTRMNSSSLMFRRTEVLYRVGYYDRVRKGADSEFIFRLRTAFGKPAVRELPVCLALVRLVTGSLSRADFLPGWQHESRVWYRELYTHWHRRISRGADPFLAIDRRQRAFPAPARFTPGDGGMLELDELFVADLRDLGPSQQRLLATARRRSAAGRRVGIAHLERFETLEPVRRGAHPTILEALFEGEFALAEWSQEVSVEHLLLWPAELPEFHGDRPHHWRVGRVSLVVEDPVPVSELPGSVGRWEASAAWATQQLGGDGRIGLVAPGTQAGAARGSEAAHLDLPEVGRIGPSSHRPEVVLVEAEATPAPTAQRGRLAAALDEHGIALRIPTAGGVTGATAAPPRGVDADAGATGRRTLDPTLPTLAVALIARADDVGRTPTVTRATQRGAAPSDAAVDAADAVRFVPLPPAGAAVEAPLRPTRGAGAAAPKRRSSCVGASTAPERSLPFVVVAEPLGPAGLPGWSSRNVDGVQYWFAEGGVADVVPLGPPHRLRSPSCAVLIHGGACMSNGGGAPWSHWSRAGIDDPSAALGTLHAHAIRAAVVAHDSHFWTIHSTALAELACARDGAGRLFAVASDVSAGRAFTESLRAASGSDTEPAPAARRLLDRDWSLVDAGMVRGDALRCSRLADDAFLPLAQLALDR